jgi:hypothetical protein
MKTCTKCGVPKDETTDFHKDSRTGRARAWCKLCTNEDNLARAAANPEKHNAQCKAWRDANPGRASEITKAWQRKNPEKVWSTAFQGRFRIDFDVLWDAQKGLCAGCGEPMLPRGRTRDSACVDHDHTCCPGKKSCGKCVRGLIHWSCNMVLGFVRDNPAPLQGLIAYLAQHAPSNRPSQDPSIQPQGG